MPTRLESSAFNTASRKTARLFKALVWGFCLLLVAGTWWFVVAQVAFERRQAIDDAVRQNENRSIAFEQYVRRTLEAADLVTRYVGARFARGEVGGEFTGRPGNPAQIAGSALRGGAFVGVSIVDANGNIVATSATSPLVRLNVADHPAFRVHVARDSGQLYVSAPIRSLALGGNLIWLSRRLNRADGSFAGVIAINILPDQFTAFYRDAQVNPKDVLSVVGLDGISRARRSGGSSTSGEDLRGTSVMRNQMERANGTFLSPSIVDGERRYFSHRAISDYPLFVIYGVLESEVLAP